MGGVASKLKSVHGLDKYILWIVMVVMIAIPLLRPLGLPIVVDNMTREFYDDVDKLPTGAKVWVENAVIPNQMAEELPGITVVMTHLMKKNVRIVLVETRDATPITIFEQYVIPDLKNRHVLTTYGVDWVQLPYVPGYETGLAALAANIRSTTPVDYYGTPLDKLSVMQGLNTVKDFDLVILFSETGGFYAYIRQIEAPYKVKFIAQQLTMDIPAIMAYYPGQVSALLKGLGGAAQYEKLLGYPARGIASTEGQSLSHVWIVLAVIAGNVYYLESKHRRKK